MSRYQEAIEALTAKCCHDCHGLGEKDDAEIGDISCRKWVCATCLGTGFKDASVRQPDGYAYVYPSLWGGQFISFGGGGERNGHKPIKVIPYYLGTPPEDK